MKGYENEWNRLKDEKRVLGQSVKEVNSSVNWNEFAEEEYNRICDKVRYWLKVVEVRVKEVDRERKRILQSVRSDPDMRKILGFLETMWSVCERSIGWLKSWLSEYVWKNVKPIMRPLNGVWLKVKEGIGRCVSWVITNGIIFVDSTWFVLCENPAVRSNDETED